jgi:signal transduction histidine kinase
VSEPLILHARLDREDRLIDADEGFGAINERAGGSRGQVLAVPQFNTLARLARRLRILIARGVTIADGDIDLDCWIKATPGDGGTSLAVSVLRERPAWRAPTSANTVAALPPPPGADWQWEVDADLRVTRIDEQAGVRHGFDAVAALSRPLTRLFAMEPDEDGNVAILDAVAERIDFDRQVATIRESGVRVFLAGSVRRDALGGFDGFVGGTYLLDETPPEPVVETFNARLDQVLRGPLGRIVANADSINAAADGSIDPHYADYAADIASAGRHLLGLVDDLVDLEAIEREDFTVEDEPIDLADVVRRAAGLLQVRAANAGVTIDRDGLDGALPARGEFRRTLQILVNLIGNAVRYSPEGATIWLRAQREGDRAVVIVADQGKGIAEADQARIFEKFERVDASEAGGSGLGLYIARRLARAMGGDLTVDSAIGMGARFLLWLPAGE